MKRILDLLLLIIIGPFLFFVFVVTLIVLKVTLSAPAIFWSNRVGRDNVIFSMPKFRSMREDAPTVATHLIDNPSLYLTSTGSFLRKTSIDELPQLWSILKGDMSFVGPRPALFNQEDLIALRTKAGVSNLLPGLTGWAQVNGRDELPITQKVAFDIEYMQRQSLWFDLKIIWMTALKVIKRDDISH